MSAQCKVCGGGFPCDNHDPCDECGKVVSIWFAYWFGDTMLCKECSPVCRECGREREVEVTS